MEKILLALALVVATSSAHAFGGFGGFGTINAAVTNSRAESTSDATGGNANVDIKQRRQWPNGTAIGAASSNTTAPYRYVDSESNSFLFWAHSYTIMVFDEIAFVADHPLEIDPETEEFVDTQVTLAACFKEQGYKSYRVYMGHPCPE